jgi:carboxypeptidase family protein
MTLAIKSSRHDDNKKSLEEEYHSIHTHLIIQVITISCLGAFMAIMISAQYEPTSFVMPFSSEERVMNIPSTDLGSVNGFVISSDGSPVDGASVVADKKMGFANSADKNGGYSTSVIADLEGQYVLDNLPSGVYKFTVTYPDNTVYTLDNYAVWPSSSSSYTIKAN